MVKIIRAYNRLAKVFIQYENIYHAAWVKSIDMATACKYDKYNTLCYSPVPSYFVCEFIRTWRRLWISHWHVWESLIFSLVLSDNRNKRSTCPTSVFTDTGQSDKR
jgi:hypothetical protein